MSDPLSIASSIAGLIALTETLVDLICTFKDAKEDIKNLTQEIRSLTVLLYELSSLAESFETNRELDTSFRLHFVDDCRVTVETAKVRLEKATRRLKSGALRASGAVLKWPYSGKEVQKLLADISRHKETMTLALSADSTKKMIQLLSKLDEMSRRIDRLHTISKDQTRIALDERRSDILDFFMRYNPQPNLEMSLRLRYPHTGLWLTEGQEFKNWLDSSQNGRLWLSGIPGAGKTILAGSIIEECLKKSSDSSGTAATCFFFCDYKEPKSQDTTSLLSSLASQLARQSTTAFEILAVYYADLNPEKGLPRSPSLSAILDVLCKMSKQFDQVFMVVDGLDECGLGSSLTKHLCWLVENTPTISMAVLSRAERHILEELEGGFTHVDIAAQSADVQLYVRAELEERLRTRKLRIRRKGLKEEIIQALIDGAQGMFRWVSCQLDYLCELPTDTDRKEALGKLPPTLNATYQRILDDTRPESIRIMETTLRIIAAAGPDITIPQLCDAVSLRDGKSSVDEDDILDEEEISRICRSLIRKSNDKNHFEFAHFTVREFLESSSLIHTPLERYHIKSDESWFLIDLCLRFISLENFSKPLYAPIDIRQTLEDIDDSHPFYQFATWEWPFTFRSNWARLQGAKEQQISLLNESVLPQIDGLFHSDKSPNFLLWSAKLALMYRQSYWVRETASDIILELMHASFTPLHMACILTLPYPTLRLIEQNTGVPAPSSTFPSPTECLLLGMPALLFDISEDLNPGAFDVLVEHFILNWMGPDTSCDIWGDLLKRLPVSFALQSQVVRFGSSRYSLLDLFCERGRDFLRWANDFRHFTLPGAILNEENIIRMQDAIDGYDGPCDNINQQKELSSVLSSIYEKAAHVFPEESLIFYLHRLLDEIDAKSNSSCEKTFGPEIGALKDQEYDSAAELATEYDNIARLRQLSCDQRFHTFHHRQAKGKSLLHIAASAGADRALELLPTLGLHAPWQDHDENTPLHFAVPHCIAILMKLGACDAVRNKNGDTVWHQTVQRNGSGIKILLNICSDITSRLVEVNDQGYTPMAMALYRGNHQAASLLLPHCRAMEAFAGPGSVYEAAVLAGMDDVIEGLIAARIPVQPGTSPIHRVRFFSSIRCLRLLKPLCPGACSERHDQRLPIENLLKELYYPKGPIEKELVLELFPEPEVLKVECLEYLCSDIIPSLTRSAYTEDEVSPAMKTVLEVFLEHKVCEAYERHRGQPATQLLANALLSRIGDPTMGWDRIRCLDSTLVRVLKASRCQAKADVSQLIQLSVHAGWENVTGELLDAKNGVPQSVYQSGLEAACRPFGYCSLATFDLLLSSAHVNELNQPSTTSGLALIHLLADKDVSERMEKLDKLLEKGVDPNARCRRNSEPALVYHAFEGSFETVKILLQNKASPELEDDDGFNAMFAMVWMDDLESLQALRESHPDTDWGQTMIIRPDYCDASECSKVVTETEVRQCSLLHVAASAGSLRCLKYLVENLVSDINAKAGLGYTCVHFAVTLGSTIGREMFEYLKSQSCDLNALNDLDKTPLDTAIQYNMPEGDIQYLLAQGAHPAASVVGILNSYSVPFLGTQHTSLSSSRTMEYSQDDATEEEVLSFFFAKQIGGEELGDNRF